MGLTDCINAWMCYPNRLGEKASNKDFRDSSKYRVQNLVYVVGEGLALGVITYYFTRDPGVILFTTLLTTIGIAPIRTMQFEFSRIFCKSWDEAVSGRSKYL